MTPGPRRKNLLRNGLGMGKHGELPHPARDGGVNAEMIDVGDN